MTDRVQQAREWHAEHGLDLGLQKWTVRDLQGAAAYADARVIAELEGLAKELWWDADKIQVHIDEIKERFNG